MTSLRLGVLQSVVGFHIARGAVSAYSEFERFIGKPFGLRKEEFSLLMLLMANGPLAPKRLAQSLALTAPNLTLVLDRLQARSLLRRERNPADGRSQNIVLTAEGEALAQASAAAAQPMEREVVSHLSAAEHAMLIELLCKLAGRGTAA